MEAPQGERLAIVETKVGRLEGETDKHAEAIVAVQLDNREQRTNWKLAAAVGGGAASLLGGLVLALAEQVIG
jgi:carbon monoxide dehydrogenase subunit G